MYKVLEALECASALLAPNQQGVKTLESYGWNKTQSPTKFVQEKIKTALLSLTQEGA